MWLQPKGYSQETDAFGNVVKADTYTCKHCQRVTEVPAKTDPNEFWCSSCMAPICKRCKRAEHVRPASVACSHFERRLAIAEARGRLWETLGLPG